MKTKLIKFCFLFLTLTCLPTSYALADVTLSNGTSGDGYWDVLVGNGAESRTANLDPVGSETATEVVYDYFHYIDVGKDGSAVRLSETSIAQAVAAVGSDQAKSSGSFAGANGTINWEVISTIEPGSELYLVEIAFSSDSEFGDVRLIQYLDEDVGAVSDDELVVIGTPGDRDFQLLTVDGTTRVGVAQGAYYHDTTNMTYIGWAADVFPDLRDDITSASGTTYSIDGNIDTNALNPMTDDQFPGLPVYGLSDITTAVAFDLDPTATSASVVLYLGGSADGSSVDIAQPIESPVFTKFNTFLSQFNYLELSNSGTADLETTLTFYNTSAQVLTTTKTTVAAGSQKDLSINEIIQNACDGSSNLCQGFSDVDGNGYIDMIGLVSIAFDDNSNGKLSGRMSNYRVDPGSNSFSFAFARELGNGLTNTTYSLANSSDPLGQGNMVPNWLELVNLDSSKQTFTYNIYNASGDKVEGGTLTLPQYGQRDILVGDTQRDSSGNLLQATYLVEVVPANTSAKYMHYISRYSSNSSNGFSDRYNFAFSAEGKNGSDSKLYMPVTAETLTNSHCAEPMSWLEVANVSVNRVTASVLYTDSEGNLNGFVPDLKATIPSMGIAHYQASPYVFPGRHGFASVQASQSNRNLVAQSVTYYYNCDDNNIQTAYVGQSWVFDKGTRAAAVNSYLGMSNDLRLFTSSGSNLSATLSITPFNGAITNDSITIPGSGLFSATLGTSGTYAFPENTYGLISIEPNSVFTRYGGMMLRTRAKFENGRTRFDYVVPISIR